MIDKSEFLRTVQEAYAEAIASKLDAEAIVFCMDNSTVIGRLVSEAMPSVWLGLDQVRADEVFVAGLPMRAAISILHDLDRQFGVRPLTELPVPPCGHFWALGFGAAGKQLAPIPMPLLDSSDYSAPRRHVGGGEHFQTPLSQGEKP